MSESELTASLLVAMPQLMDSNFKRTVVLIVRHDEEGTFGLVLNREVELTITDLCSSLEVEWGGDPDLSIHWGGPVRANTGWVLFDSQLLVDTDDDDITEVSPGLHFAGSIDVLRLVAEMPTSAVRIYLGYAGWGPDQLEFEMSQGAWLVVPLGLDIVFDTPSESMWEHVVRRLGIEPSTLISTHGIH